MKRLLLPALAVPCLLFLPLACGDPPAKVEVPRAKERPKPKVFRPDDLKAEAAARDAALDREIAALETEAEKLRQEIAREQLTVDQAALREEQVRLEEERASLLLALPLPALPVETPPEADPAPLPPAGDYDLFYTGLSAYGQWFESVDYGYVWQPSVARHASWRPYTLGCWTACDRGWVWVSEEPFGWATYHYGRWACLKDRGWIWVPGEIWAPAWVAWRRSPDYVGWCPLPPETLYQTGVTYDATIDQRCGLQPASYIFIAAKHFCLPVHRHGEPARHSARICRNTTNITRLTVSRHGVDRCGPAYDWIRQCLGHAPPQYRLACGPRPQSGAHSQVEGTRLCLYAPRMQAPWNPLLRPGTLAGSLTLAAADRQDATPPDKGLKAFREARRSWQDRASSAMKETPVRRFAERQEKIRSLQSTLTTAMATPRASPARPAGPEASRTAPLSSIQRRELKDAATEKIASQRQLLNRMRGQEDSGDLSERVPPTSPAVTSASGTRSAPPARLPTPATRSLQGPAVASSPPRNAPPGRTQPPGIASGPDSATRSKTQEAPTTSQTPPVFRRATTTAIIPGRPATGDPVSGPDPGSPPVGDQADSRATQVARLKEEIAANRQSLMDQRNGTAPDAPGILPRNAAEEPAGAVREQPTARQLEAEEQARQQALAEAQAAALQQAMAEAQAEAEARRNQETAREAEQSRIQRAAMERANQQQQQQQQQAARAQEIARQQEAARQQQMAEQSQRQAENMARQQEAARQQQMAEQRQRQAEDMARQQEAARQQQMAEQRQRQAAEMARQQEAARQQQMAEQQQRQAEAIARQQEAARQQQMVEQRQRQAEEIARQKEAARQQQENEQRQRQAQEAARQQEAVRQQKAADEAGRRNGR